MSNADRLFLRIRKNDEAALDSLFRIYYPRLNDYARKVTRDSEVAKDIVQDVFVKTWERRDKIEVKNIEAFLFRVVRNQCLDYIKYIKVVENRMFEFGETERVEELYRVDFVKDEPVLLIEKELNDEIHRVIEALPEKCREVFLMSRVTGLKNREIAEKLNINIKNVERHINRALKAFETRFSGELPVAIFILVFKTIAA